MEGGGGGESGGGGGGEGGGFGGGFRVDGDDRVRDGDDRDRDGVDETRLRGKIEIARGVRPGTRFEPGTGRSTSVVVIEPGARFARGVGGARGAQLALPRRRSRDDGGERRAVETIPYTYHLTR